MMNVLALDLSSSTGYALFQDGKLTEYGRMEVEIKDFNVNAYPEKSVSYPFNIIDAVYEMANRVMEVCRRVHPDHIVIENTVRGRNRHTQRFLEFLHFAILVQLRVDKYRFVYRDPSQWRSILGVRLNDEDKKNNRLVSAGKKRGRITSKHLSVRFANEIFGLDLILKDNDVADAILLGHSFLSTQGKA